MKLLQTKTQRELEALRDMEKTLERRERCQRVAGFIAAGTTLLALTIGIVRAVRRH